MLVEGSATYPGLWFPARWFYAFPGLSSPDLPRWQAAGAYYGSLVLLGMAWMWFLRAVRAAPRFPAWLVLVVFVLWSVPFLVGPPASSEDVYAYAGTGLLVERGLDPYEVGVAALGPEPVVNLAPPFWIDDPAPYGPLSLRTAWAASVVTDGSARATVIVLRLIGMACLLLLALPLTFLARRAGARPAVALAAVLCSPLVLLQLVGAAHNETLMLVLLTGGVAVGLAGLAHERRDRRLVLFATGVALCGAGAAVKVPALAGAVLLGWMWAGAGASTWKRLPGVIASGVLATVVVVGVSLGSGLGLGWVNALDVPQGAYTLLAPFTAFGVVIQEMVGALGWPEGWVLSWMRPAGTVLGVVVAGLFIMRTDRLGPTLALGLALLALGATTPAVWPWYATWGLVFVGVTSMPAGLQVAVVAVNLAVTPLGPGTLDVTNRPNAGAVFMTLVVLGAGALVLRDLLGRGRRPEPATVSTSPGGLGAGDG